MHNTGRTVKQTFGYRVYLGKPMGMPRRKCRDINHRQAFTNRIRKGGNPTQIQTEGRTHSLAGQHITSQSHYFMRATGGGPERTPGPFLLVMYLSERESARHPTERGRRFRAPRNTTGGRLETSRQREKITDRRLVSFAMLFYRWLPCLQGRCAPRLKLHKPRLRHPEPSGTLRHPVGRRCAIRHRHRLRLRAHALRSRGEPAR
jgi:hypothetical protein